MEISNYQMKILDYGIMSMTAARGWIDEMIKEKKLGHPVPESNFAEEEKKR